jgi:hypothetical protein
MTSIKPCPLCGRDAGVIFSHNCGIHFVVCRNMDCGIELQGGFSLQNGRAETKDELIARWNALPRTEGAKAEMPPFKYVALCHHGEEVRYPGYSRQALTGAGIVFPTVTKPSVIVTQIGFAETADGPLLLIHELGECIGYLCEARFSGLKDNRGA